jgi:hypothetical protein
MTKKKSKEGKLIMKYINKIPQADPELREALLAEGWKKIREPSSLFIAFLLSIPFMIINALVCWLIIFITNPSYMQIVNVFLFSVSSWSFTIRFDYIIYLYLFILLHEAIHLLFIPSFYRSEKTYFGIKPWGGFVFTTEKLSKGRFLLVTVAPFVVISVLIPFVLGLAGLLSGFMVFLIFINAISSCVDMLNAALIAIQVPNGSIIVNNGFETYYGAAKPS